MTTLFAPDRFGRAGEPHHALGAAGGNVARAVVMNGGRLG